MVRHIKVREAPTSTSACNSKCDAVIRVAFRETK